MSTLGSQVNFTTPLDASLQPQYNGFNFRAERTSPALVAPAPVVFVVDDDAMNIRSFEALLCAQGYAVRAYDSAASFLRSIDASMPGCVLLNLTLPDATGLDVQTHLVTTGCVQPVVFFSSCRAVRAIVQALKAGAEDFIELPFEDAILLSAVERAIERDRRSRARRLEEDAYVARLERLTPRERQVLGHVIAGRLNKQIAVRLGATEKTIKVHRARMMRKMSVRSVAELTRLAGSIGVQPEA
jgi:FixJ family two-component response regulator